jgi:Golgi nucleoside diphosphatase
MLSINELPTKKMLELMEKRVIYFPQFKEPKPIKRIETEGVKQCSQCKETKSVKEFHRRVEQKKEGLVDSATARCKVCLGNYQKNYRSKRAGYLKKYLNSYNKFEYLA